MKDFISCNTNPIEKLLTAIDEQWLAEMSSLETFNLTCVFIYSESEYEIRYGDWFHVFDAIRTHPRALQLNFESVLFDSGRSECFWHNSDKVEKFSGFVRSHRERQLRRSLALYLDGEIELDDTLRRWFKIEESPDV